MMLNPIQLNPLASLQDKLIVFFYSKPISSLLAAMMNDDLFY